MKEAFKKIVERLEERKGEDICDNISCVECHKRYKTDSRDSCYLPIQKLVYDNTIEIVNEVAEEFGTDIYVGSNDGWIPISSGNLPDERIDVLCCNDDGKIMVGHIYWDEDEQDFIAWGRIGAYNDWMPQVVAWMPIVPYKEGE